MSYIEFKNIQKSYQGIRVIENFNLEIEQASFVSLTRKK
jgi:ABC-type sugar transport system ATPase subunit